VRRRASRTLLLSATKHRVNQVSQNLVVVAASRRPAGNTPPDGNRMLVVIMSEISHYRSSCSA